MSFLIQSWLQIWLERNSGKCKESNHLQKNNYFNWRLITLQYCGGFCHTSTWISHRCTCVPPSQTPLPPSSPPCPSRWFQRTSFECPTSCIELALVIYYTYGNIHFNAILLNHLTLAFSHIVWKSVLHIWVSFSALYIGSPLLSF